MQPAPKELLDEVCDAIWFKHSIKYVGAFFGAELTVQAVAKRKASSPKYGRNTALGPHCRPLVRTREHYLACQSPQVISSGQREHCRFSPS